MGIFSNIFLGGDKCDYCKERVIGTKERNDIKYVSDKDYHKLDKRGWMKKTLCNDCYKLLKEKGLFGVNEKKS